MDNSTGVDRDTELSAGAGNVVHPTSVALLDEWQRLRKVVSETLRGDVREEGWRARFLEEAAAVRALAEAKIAELIRRIDVYTAKLSRRASRPATSPAIAARDALL